MRVFVAAVALIGLATAVNAQKAIPDLKGTWIGAFRTVIFGNNPHHPGDQTVADAPRVRELQYTFDITGQDGALLWGYSWSDPAVKEPFAWSISPDGKNIHGADTDGAFSIVIDSDRLDLCYVNSALSPAKAIIASCGAMTRQ